MINQLRPLVRALSIQMDYYSRKPNTGFFTDGEKEITNRLTKAELLAVISFLCSTQRQRRKGLEVKEAK